MTQIIFNSFEEFEDAVMEVVRNRLSVSVQTQTETQFDSDYVRLEVSLGDYTGTTDYFTSDATSV